ncbi:MAG: hypothetical protein WDN23_15815 [Edaphobacter sp.]
MRAHAHECGNQTSTSATLIWSPSLIFRASLVQTSAVFQGGDRVIVNVDTDVHPELINGRFAYV